jgi:hypothetical protein
MMSSPLEGRASYVSTAPGDAGPTSTLDGSATNSRKRTLLAAAWFLVAVAVEFNLWTLRAEALPVTYQNDSVVHVTMVDWASDRVEAGHLPLDGWFPNLGLGSAQFHHYQSLPHILTGLVATVFGTTQTFAVLLYLLLCLWPLSVYWSARLLGWGPWTAAVAAFAAPLVTSTPGFGYEASSYTWEGWGMWSQLWGMWLLPLAWALTWRAVARRGSIALAALVLSLTLACHYMTGYLAFMSVGVVVIVGLRDLRERITRGVLVLLAALAASAWVVVPVLLDRTWIVKDEFLAKVPFWHDSFGAPKVLGWLVRGELYDGGRFPILTILVGLGVVVCVARWRRNERGRLLLALWVMSLLLFFGRPTLGPILDLLPASEELYLHRYVIGVHMAGILLAGVGGAWLAGSAFTLLTSRLGSRAHPRMVGAAVGLAFLALLFPALQERAVKAAQGGRWVHEQRAVDETEGRDVAALVRSATSIEPGRFYSGLLTNWGVDYKMGYVPFFRVYAPLGADSIGNTIRTASLMTTVEPRFDETNAGQYDLFNVRYVILPADRPPSVPAVAVARRNGNVLWSISTTGYMRFVDVVGPPIVADRDDIGPKTESFLDSDLPGRGLYRPVSFAGSPSATVTADAASVPSTPPGTVGEVSVDLAAGYARATVDVARPGALVLKASFDPRWRIMVDGVEVAPQMFSPSYVGRELSPGRHEVSFEYVPFPRYDVLFAIALVTLVGSTLATRLRRRRRAPEVQDG